MKTFDCSAPLKKSTDVFREWLPRLLLGAVLVICLAAAGGRPALGGEGGGPFDAEVEPKIISGNSLDDWTAGLSYKVNYRRYGLYDIQLGEADTLLEVNLTGTLAVDSALNTETLISEALIGASLLTGQAAEDDLVRGQDPKADVGKAADYRSRGYFYAGADLRHETDQKLKEHHLGVGLEAGYVNPKDVGIWSFVPSVVMALEWIDPFESQLRDDLSVEKSGFARLRLEASLKSGIGQRLFKGTSLEPIGLRIDYRYFLSNDLDDALEADGQDEMHYFAAALTYTRNGRLGPFHRQTFFIKLSDGRLPPATEDETVVSLGVIVPVGTSLKKTD